MLNGRTVRRMKLGLLTSFGATGGMMLESCSLTDIKDSVVAGALSGLQTTVSGWVGGLFPNFNELFIPLFNIPIWTP